MFIYRLVYRGKALFYKSADVFLTELNLADSVDKRTLFNHFSENAQFDEIITHLAQNGFIEIDERNVSITTSGKFFISKGCFKGKAIRRTITAFAFIIGFVASITTIMAFIFDMFD